MKKIRVGIIGQGRSGHSIHYHTLSLAPETFQIVAVCDQIAERTREAVETAKAEAYTDYKKLLARKDLDLVVNSSPKTGERGRRRNRTVRRTSRLARPAAHRLRRRGRSPERGRGYGSGCCGRCGPAR